MVLFFSNGDTFARGAARYNYRPATEGEATNRIILQVDIAGILIEAVVDTGAPYVVLAPQILSDRTATYTEILHLHFTPPGNQFPG
ncbi:MAG: hypothetical protein U7127_19375 [Phormidium sp.]